MSKLVGRLQRFFYLLARAQVERPWIVAILAVATTLPALLAARSLGLKTDFSELLPDNKPSVVEMRRVGEKLTAASTLTLVAEVPESHPEALERFAQAVVPKIQALGPDWVGAVDAGNRDARAFLEQNKLLYAPLDEIRKVHDDVRERYDYEVQKRAGGDLDLGEAPPPISIESLKEKFSKAEGKFDEKAGKSGYYIGEGGRMLAILVRTPVEPGSIEPAHRLRAKIDEVVRDANPTSFDPKMTIGYTGDFITSVEEYEAVKNDLGHVGVYGVFMVLGAVMLFFLRVRTLLAMGITIAIGIVWTFGAARVLIGYLNSSTGFLVSIIAGNGINFGIIYMARYLEARRVEGKTSAEAVMVAHRETWVATLAAAGAAMLSYGSLAITNFRGFKHFGVIGGTGMLLCWIATYLFLPTILVVSERTSPMFLHPNALRTRLRGFYGYGFAWLAERFPRGITLVAAAAGVFSIAATVHYFTNDPMEYDMTHLRTVSKGGRTPAGMLSERVDSIVGRLGQDGMAIMVDRLDQALPVKSVLEQRRDAAPADAKPFEQVVTIFDLLPKDEAEKVPLLNETRDLLLRAHSHGMFSAKEWADISPYVSPAPVRVVGVADLPEQMARAFTEKDGTRGRIVYITPKDGRSVWDGHYLELWADSFRTITLPNGETIHGSGRAVIFADVIRAVVEDAPKAIVASFAGTWLVVLFAFRGKRAGWTVLLTLLLGVAGMVAFLAVKQLKLNFLNFVALPITFGIGVDYAVNVMERIRREGTENMRQVIIETGGAVVLCSMTTTLGYLALTLSNNLAITSFGLAAAAGEVACILAAVLVMPAALLWLAPKKPAPKVSTAVAA
jgi:predicted RND superfamily exporter protein